MKTIAFGDIHGCYKAAERAVQLAGELKAQAVFLGDYVDRGPDSIKTLQILLKAKKQNPNWIFIRGNHDQMLLDVINGKRIAGGYDRDTYEQTLPMFKATDNGFKKEAVDFLETTKFYYETNEFIFVHALLNDDKRPISKKLHKDLIWNYSSFPEWIGKPFIHGHYNTKHIEFAANRINLNTSCGYGGKLTGLMIDEDNPGNFDIYEIGEEGEKLNEYSIINKDLHSFRIFNSKTLFYPACGTDIIEPIKQCSEIDTFVFNDVRDDFDSILNMLQQHFKVLKVYKRELNNIKINGYTNSMNFVLYEFSLKTKKGKRFNIMLVIGKAYAVFEYFFKQLDNILDLFYYRGDGMGEGGSAMIWFKKARFKPLIEKLTQENKSGVIITDGSNFCDFKPLKAWMHGLQYERFRRKFTYYPKRETLYEFNPVEVLGEYNRNGVVKWEVNKLY